MRDLETFIRLIDYLVITSTAEGSNKGQLLGWDFASTKQTKAFFRDDFKDPCLYRYTLIVRLLDELHIDNIEVSIEVKFNPEAIDFEYYLTLTIDDDDEY